MGGDWRVVVVVAVVLLGPKKKVQGTIFWSGLSSVHPSILLVQFSVKKLQAGDAVRRICSHSTLPMLTFQFVLVQGALQSPTLTHSPQKISLLSASFNLPIWKSVLGMFKTQILWSHSVKLLGFV